MTRLSRWIAFPALGLAGLVAGCGSSAKAPSPSMEGPLPYTFTLPGGRHVAAGDYPGYVAAPPPVVTVHSGEIFTMTPGNVASAYTPPVPRPNGPAVVVVSTQRTPHAGTRATYRAVEPGRALLVIHSATFCLPAAPQQGQPVRVYRREERAQRSALEHPQPRDCPALAVLVTG